MVIVTGIQALVQLVIRHRVQHLRIHPARVIPVNHLAHQPEILLLIARHPAHFPHKVKIQAVRAVEPDAIDVELMDPETDHIKKIILHLAVLQVQVRQLRAVPPRLVAEAIVIIIVPPEIDSLVPAAIARPYPRLRSC